MTNFLTVGTYVWNNKDKEDLARRSIFLAGNITAPGGSHAHFHLQKK